MTFQNPLAAFKSPVNSATRIFEHHFQGQREEPAPQRIIISLVLLVAILCFILLFHFIPQPWRGILDAGVVVGLVWGTLATVFFSVMALIDPTFNVDPELC